jgi:hypothetical protein
MDEVERLIGLLGDADEQVRDEAVQGLGELKDRRAIPALVRALGDVSMSIRTSAAQALGEVEALAVPALKEKLLKGDEKERADAAFAIFVISDGCEDGLFDKHMGALVKSLDDPNREVRRLGALTLIQLLKNCETVDAVSEFETHLQEGFDSLAKKHIKKDEIAVVVTKFSKLRIAAARKKNSLASKRDIILEDIPRPPKKGEVYQQIRRTVRNG